MDIRYNHPFTQINAVGAEALPAELPSAEPAGFRKSELFRQKSGFLNGHIERKLQTPVPDEKSDRRRIKSLYPA